MLRERWTWLFSGGTVLAYCILFYLQYANGITLSGTFGIKIAADLLSILLLHAAGLRLAEKGGAAAVLLGKVYRYSFPVYLCHSLFLTALEAHLPRLGITRLSAVLLIRALVCYTLPFLLCRKHPFLAAGWVAVALSLVFLNPYTSVTPLGLLGGIRLMAQIFQVPGLNTSALQFGAAIAILRGGLALILTVLTVRLALKVEGPRHGRS